ncbi:MAG: hypothetical protein HGB11_00515 [Chlorobiales bacterium]|nr:hypothetical protein [Chlorobiales bacterium]
MQQKEYSYHEEAKSAISNGIDEQISQYYGQFKATPAYHAIKKAGEDTVEYVKKNPVKAALISLGAGFLVGLLFSRKR